MTTLEKWEMGDPEKVAIRREAQRIRMESQCGACLFKRERIEHGKTEYFCMFRKRVYGNRCILFKRDPIIVWEESCK